MPEPFTKQAMFDELRNIMWAVADSLSYVYSEEAGFALLGLSKAECGKKFVFELESSDIDLDKFKITPNMDAIYDHGILAHWDINNPHWVDLILDATEFIDGLQNFHLLSETSIPHSLEKCLYAMEMSTARWALDGGDSDSLSLRQVALLAGMDEKSVRNAANPKAKAHLKTFNHEGKTYCRVEDAKEWLAGRRGFKPTEYFDSRQQIPELQPGFDTPEAFGRFIKERREALKLSLEDVVSRSGLGKSYSARDFEALEAGDFSFDLRKLKGLAYALDFLPPHGFLRAANALHQKRESEALERYLTSLTAGDDGNEAQAKGAAR